MHPVLENIDRNWKDHSRILFYTDLGQGLQVTQLKGNRLLVYDAGCLCQFRCCLAFAVRVDNLGSLLTFRFGLLGHSPLHFLGQIDLFDLHEAHLDAPCIRMLIKNRLELDIECLSPAQQIVQINLAEHGA